MRETIYIQVGPLSNHVGAHFWNTQEAYFTYGADPNSALGTGVDDNSNNESESFVDHDESFREGVSWGKSAEPTFCPRVLVFDYKSNFGALGKYNDLYADEDVGEKGTELEALTWSGSLNEHRQPNIPKSEYLQRLDDGKEDELNPLSDSELDTKDAQKVTGRSNEGQAQMQAKHFSPQYWSDYNRMYFIPRSVHALSDSWIDTTDSDANGVNKVYGFGRGREVYRRYEQEHSLIEEDFRRFVEECDLLQGIHFTFDAYARYPFSGFTCAMIESVRDEFAKTAILGVPIGLRTNAKGGLDTSASQTLIHDISTILALEEYATGVIPLQDPMSAWGTGVDVVQKAEFDSSSVYHTSSILSAHLESATLPLRLRNSSLTLGTLLSQLNWVQSNKYSNLAGLIGEITSNDLRDEMILLYDFTAADRLENNIAASSISQHLVARGVDPSSAKNYVHREGPQFTRYSLPTYPVLSSSPVFLRQLARGITRGETATQNSKRGGVHSTNASSSKTLPLPLLSSLHASTATTASRFASYAQFIETSIRNGAWRDLISAGQGVAGVDGIGGYEGIDLETEGAGAKDSLKEVAERLWKVAEGCGWEYDTGEGADEDSV